MKTFRIALFLLVTCPGISSGQTAFDIGIADGTSDARLPLNDTRIEIEGQEIKLEVVGKRARFVLPSLPQLAALSIEAGSPYVTRRLSIQKEGLSKVRTFLFNVEKRPERFTKSYLTKGVQRLQRGEVDKALALFELAANHDEKRKQNAVLDGYEAILRYNYARSLQRVCLDLHYTTCKDAEEHFTAIAADMSSSDKVSVYENNAVSKKLVDTALEHLRRATLQNEYAEAAKQINSGDPAAAQKQLENLLARRANELERFTAVNLSVERLRSDLILAVTLQREAAAKALR